MARATAILLFAALALTAAPPQAEAGEAAHLHALVIGIDDYASRGALRNLHGAVNDARLIAATLERLGVGSLRLLLDGEAGRDAIFRAWRDMKRGARPGDTLLVTYAGHGGQEPERLPGSEADGLDEVLLLGGFRPQAPYNYERIFDYEWRALVEEASDFNVVLVFDACHSGTANRAMQGPEGLPARFADLAAYGAIENDSLPLPTARLGAIPAALEHETYVGASQDEQVVHEILIEGRPHGALSHLFARALLGAADADGDGQLTRGELRRYLHENVRQLTESRQTPNVDFVGAGERPLFPVPPPQAESLEPPLLALHVMAEDGPSTAAFAGVRPAPSPREADLLWDPAGGFVFSGLGDLVAERVSAGELQGLVDKWRTLAVLKRLAERQPLPLRLREGDGLFRPPARVTIAVEPREGPYLTLVNLASTGVVNYLYPHDGSLDARFVDDPLVAPDVPFELPAAVRPPFGADHLVALSSRVRPEALQRAMMRLDGQPAALEALALLVEAKLAEPEQQLGLLGFYTAAPD